MIKRTVDLKNYIEDQKVTIVYGPRQVGKTTLVKEYISNFDGKVLYHTGDDIQFASDFSKSDLEFLKKLLKNVDLLVIDEAQLIENVGRSLKLVVDNISPIKVVVTGSSSFDLANKTGEALTGRKNTINLYPFSYHELIEEYGQYNFDRNIADYLRFGNYPEIVTQESYESKEIKVKELANSYLLKDILNFDLVKNSKVIWDLLKLLAFQLGNEISQVELGNSLGIDKKTVARYLDLLEKSFILYRLDGFSRNLRKEVSKMSKYYFYDLGVRNTLISNFNDLDTRNDLGQLWENYMIMEHIKYNSYHRNSPNLYFWRTYDQKEIDLIIETGGSLKAVEFKWNKDKKVSPPKDWIENYPDSSFEVIHPGNVDSFL